MIVDVDVRSESAGGASNSSFLHNTLSSATSAIPGAVCLATKQCPLKSGSSTACVSRTYSPGCCSGESLTGSPESRGHGNAMVRAEVAFSSNAINGLPSANCDTKALPSRYRQMERAPAAGIGRSARKTPLSLIVSSLELPASTTTKLPLSSRTMSVGSFNSRGPDPVLPYCQTVSPLRFDNPTMRPSEGSSTARVVAARVTLDGSAKVESALPITRSHTTSTGASVILRRPSSLPTSFPQPVTHCTASITIPVRRFMRTICTESDRTRNNGSPRSRLYTK